MFDQGIHSLRRGARGALLVGLTTLLLAACQTAPFTGATTATAPLPPLPVQGTAHYRLDAARSDVRFLVYKAGPLAHFGHDHVITAKQLSGEVYLAGDIRDSGFELTLPVAGFVVDDAAARAAEGPDFAGQPSASDIDGTREHMLGAGELDAAHFPEVSIRSVRLLGSDTRLEATVRVSLHGTARDLVVPIVITRDAGTLSATGAFDIKQTDFGITPFSFLGGALSVADTVHIRFHLAAVPSP